MTTGAAVHIPRYQNGAGGRFVVCSCTWRSGTGDAGEVRDQFAQHLRTVGEA